MKKLAEVLIVATLTFLLVALPAENRVNHAKQDTEELQLRYTELEGSYDAEQKVRKETVKSYSEALYKISVLEYQQKTQQDKIADLERQLLQASRVSVSRASRGGSRTHVSTAAVDRGGDFWARLSRCECRSGHCDDSGGFFQFKGSTARKVGFSPGESYLKQRSEAIWWAAQIHPREGTTSGWPHCWWVALRGA